MTSNHFTVGPDHVPRKEQATGRVANLCAESRAYYNSIPYAVAFLSAALVISWIGLLAEVLP